MAEPPPVEATPLDWALYYHDLGLCIVPAADGRPKTKWKLFQDARPTTDQLQGWFRGETLRNSKILQLYAVCGRVSQVVVLDCDSPAAEDWWAQHLGADLMNQTAHAQSGSGRGHHYWFRLGDQDVKGRSRHNKDDPEHSDNWDLRAEGGGVVLPPSRHRSGGIYSWIVPLSEIQPWPYPEILSQPESEGGLQSDGSGSSTLAGLLSCPGEGGRNNWVTRVLGHYAKAIRFEDGFRATAEMVWSIASQLGGEHPYERAEFDRTVVSIWDVEHAKPTSSPPSIDNGWLSGTGTQIMTPCAKGDDTWLAPWSNFDIKAKAAVVSDDDTVSYIVDVITERERLSDVPLLGSLLGATEQLTKWLASRRLVLYNPKGDVAINVKAASRLQLYLDSQNPRRMAGTPWMGWVDLESGPLYVTEQGAITAAGIQPLEQVGVTPDPRKVAQAEAVWRYGFEGTEDQACAILREVLTFHDPLVCSLFGAIWALAPIKGAIMKESSLFPHLAIIAPSEAGKTNGYFDLMLQANGRLNAGATYTPASLRDDLARHRGGFVWIDDPANIDDLGDLLRAAAGEGVHTKKGGVGWDQTVRTHLVAPIVISAEGLDMLNERAMADRVIQFEVPNPTDRRSRRGDYQQWDDIIALQGHAGSLSQYAGHFVRRAWEWLHSIGGQAGLRSLLLSLRVGSGRVAEKTAVVRVGARCLAYIAQVDQWGEQSVGGYPVGGGEPILVVDIVDAWATGQSCDSAGEGRRGPYLLEVVMSGLLADKRFVPSYRSAPTEPIFMDQHGRLRVNVPGVAQEWQRMVPRRQDRARAAQLGSLSALSAEAKSLHLGPTQPIKGKRYSLLDEHYARLVIEKAGFDYEAVVDDIKSELSE